LFTFGSPLTPGALLRFARNLTSGINLPPQVLLLAGVPAEPSVRGAGYQDRNEAPFRTHGTLAIGPTRPAGYPRAAKGAGDSDVRISRTLR